MLLSIGIIFLTSLPLMFLTANPNIRGLVYPLAFFQGIGLSIMLNTATSLISDVIGNDLKSSAFVYGCYSLFDKFANGGILFVIIERYSKNETALKYVMSLVPIICALMAFVLTFIGDKYFSHKMV